MNPRFRPLITPTKRTSSDAVWNVYKAVQKSLWSWAPSSGNIGPITSVLTSARSKRLEHGQQNLSLAISPSVTAGSEYTTRRIPLQNIAPVHIGQGSQLVYKVHSWIMSRESLLHAWFTRLVSAWQVGLLSVWTVFSAVSITSPLCTRHAPKGWFPFFLAFSAKPRVCLIISSCSTVDDIL